MKYLLKKSGFMRSINDFANQMRNPAWVDEGPGIPQPIALFLDEPEVAAEEFLGMIARMPNELAGKAADLMKESQGLVMSEDERADLTCLAAGVTRVGQQMDSFTRFLAEQQHWVPIYNAPVSVLRVWRTREDRIVGTPEERKLPINEVPNRLSSIVVCENDDGTKPRVMLSLSSGHYRPDLQTGDVREDFLLDLPGMYGHGGRVDSRGVRGRGASRDKSIGLFTDVVERAMPLLLEILYVAEILNRRDCLDDSRFDFSEKVIKTTELKAELNPDAKYEIGGWA